MVVRRRHTFDERLALGVKMRCRWETERDIVTFANVLVVQVDGEWRTADLFDCTHEGCNDHHRYDFDGYKHPATTFHHGMPAEAHRSSMRLIRSEFGRMIERWQW